MLLMAAAPARGQQQLLQPQQPAEEQAEPISIPIPPERASPRATMQTFLVAMVDYAEEGEPSQLDDAVDCLDLSEIASNVREEVGKRLAHTLKDVIDHTRFVIYEEIPDSNEGVIYYFLLRTEGEVAIDRQPDGQWLFTAQTVATLDALYDAVEDQAVVEGVVEAPTTPDQWLRDKMPESLRRRAILLEHWQWLALLVIITAGVFIDRIGIFILEAGLLARLRRTLTGVKPGVLHRALRPFGLLVMALVWRFGMRWIGLPSEVYGALVLATNFVAAASAVLGLYRLVDVAGAILEVRAARTESKFDDLLVPLFRKSFKIFIAAFGIVFIADQMDISITALLTGLGLGGVALALASKDSVENLLGSLTVILDRPFNVGDWVVIGDDEGTIEEVGFRSTRIRTFYNSLITIPNSNMIKATVDNLGERRYRRWKTMISISYNTPPDKIEAFCEGIRELVRRHPYTRKDYYHVYLNAFAASSLDILLYIFHETPDWSTELRERHRLAVDIVRLAARLGVEFAYPTQTVYLGRARAVQPSDEPTDESGEVDGALDLGRREARGIVEAILGSDGKIPPPVAIDVPESVSRGESGDGTE